MAEKVVAGSVPMATATSSREPFKLPSASCGIAPAAARNGDCAAGRLRHHRYARGGRVQRRSDSAPAAAAARSASR